MSSVVNPNRWNRRTVRRFLVQAVIEFSKELVHVLEVMFSGGTALICLPIGSKKGEGRWTRRKVAGLDCGR